jgi:paraquat-inducible protein A
MRAVTLAARMRILTAILLAVSAFSLALGITLPLLRFERLVFFSDTPSLVQVIRDLWATDNAILAIVVALFSVLLPALKIAAAQALLAADEPDGPASQRIRRILGIVSKWSMMDVLLVALLIFAAKTSGLADAFTQPGLWFFALSVVTTAVAMATLK